MREALDESNLDLSDIQFINSHATSTPIGDLAEVIAINNVFLCKYDSSLTIIWIF